MTAIPSVMDISPSHAMFHFATLSSTVTSSRTGTVMVNHLTKCSVLFSSTRQTNPLPACFVLNLIRYFIDDNYHKHSVVTHDPMLKLFDRFDVEVRMRE